MSDDQKAAGRPTDYREEFCEQIIEWAKEGWTFAEMASSLGVTRQTLHNWKKAHPRFLDAYTRAEQEGEAYWLRRMRVEMIFDPKVNAPMAKLYFANRFGWSDKLITEHTGKDGGPIEVSARDRISSRIAGIAARKREGGNPPDADGG